MDVLASAASTAPRSRRAALRAGGALAAALAGLGRASAQEATPAAGGEDAGPVFVHGFGSGSLFRTQGSSPDLPPYTLYLWDAADRTVFFAGWPERAAGVVPTERFLRALGAAVASDPPAAALVARPADDAGVVGGEEAVWVLTLRFAGAGSDTEVTYQGDLLAAAEAEARFGVRPAPEPTVQNLGAGYVFVAGVPGVDAGEADGLRLTLR